MTEREFRRHVMDLDDAPDPDEQTAHFTKCCAVLLNAIAGMFGKPPFGRKALFPWLKDEDRGLTVAEVQGLESVFPVIEGLEITLSDEDIELLNRYGA